MAVVRTFVMAVVRAQKPLFLNFGWFSQKNISNICKNKEKNKITKSKTKLESRFKKPKKSINNSKNKLRNL